VELVSNLTWIAVALALWGIWLAQRRSPRAASLSLGFRGQLVALTVLTLILLPVISVSDDLQASHNPAEAERACLRNDQHLLRPEAVPPAPAALVVVISCLLLASPRTIAFLCPPSVSGSEPTPYVRGFASRPPPAA
jgi:hypothetical protein